MCLPRQVLFILCVDLNFWYFPFVQKTSFNIYCRTGLPIMNSVGFCLSESLYFAWISESYFPGIEFQFDSFSFQYFKGMSSILVCFGLPSFWQEFCYLYFCVCKVIFSLYILNIFFFVPGAWFPEVCLQSTCIWFSLFLLLGICELLGSVGLWFSSQVERFWPWVVWLSWLGVIQQNKRSWVWFLVRAHV